jgi:hypothetical protein
MESKSDDGDGVNVLMTGHGDFKDSIGEEGGIESFVFALGLGAPLTRHPMCFSAGEIGGMKAMRSTILRGANPGIEYCGRFVMGIIIYKPATDTFEGSAEIEYLYGTEGDRDMVDSVEDSPYAEILNNILSRMPDIDPIKPFSVDIDQCTGKIVNGQKMFTEEGFEEIMEEYEGWDMRLVLGCSSVQAVISIAEANGLTVSDMTKSRFDKLDSEMLKGAGVKR